MTSYECVLINHVSFKSNYFEAFNFISSFKDFELATLCEIIMSSVGTGARHVLWPSFIDDAEDDLRLGSDAASFLFSLSKLIPSPINVCGPKRSFNYQFAIWIRDKRLAQSIIIHAHKSECVAAFDCLKRERKMSVLCGVAVHLW
jgi:hypothetical protein